MRIERRFTAPGRSPFDQVEWTQRDCVITNPDGSVVFEMRGAEVPASWSQLASDIMVSKYFRRAGVPQADGSLGSETSVRQVIHRLAGCWRHWGESHGYFDTVEDAEAFYDELCHTLLHQMAAPNSPQWFNTGLNWAYGITGPSQGHYYVDPASGELVASGDAYTHPQPHACFIQSVRDDLVGEGGIMDLWTREARLFKYGSGTGTNFSGLRGEGEPLSGGGSSSGLMSWLKIGDRAAGAIKSGGTTRRAAKMVCLDVDHPDIEAFVNWKVNEEDKVAAMVAGGKGRFDTSYEGEAYVTVSGQNSNNSVRVTEEFLEAVERDSDWHLRWRTDGRVSKTLPARKLWEEIGEAAWRCADPGLQYDTTINEWHTCPQSGRINASNPCSEYMFLDDTACNLASLNLLTFLDEETARFDIEGYKHAIHLWTVVLEISVLMAQFPSKEIAQKSYEFRTLGLGYANLGTCLMVAGIPYDSDAGRAIAGALAAILTGESYATSAQLAAQLGAFPKYAENSADMLRVMRNHRRAAYGVGINSGTGALAGQSAATGESAHPTEIDDYENLSIKPVAIDPAHCPDYLLAAARGAWDSALKFGEQHGYRNAQTTVIAPTGTIGLLMDCDTTGVEPDFALVKFKKLAGGGYFKIVNQSLPRALRNLGYTPAQIDDIIKYVIGSSSFDGAPEVNRLTLLEKGFTDEELHRIEATLHGVFELSHAFGVYSLGEELLSRLGFTREQWSRPGFNVLHELGFGLEQVERAGDYICGMMTVEGAPHLRAEHLPVFDCANRCGKHGRRFIQHEGHIRMMAAVQPFVSGAISKTINMPHEATVDDILDAYMLSWKLGLKANALYRDGCKLSQPLSTRSKDGEVEKEEEKEITVGAAAGGAGILARHEDADKNVRATSSLPEPVSPAHARVLHINEPIRRPLPRKRHGYTVEGRVGGHKLYLRTGEYSDGSLGEIFVDLHKEGAAFRSLMNCFAIAVSKGLQYGVPLEEFVDTFIFTKFEPSGPVDHPNIKMAGSVIDYIFRVLGLEYLGRTDFVQVKPIDAEVDDSLGGTGDPPVGAGAGPVPAREGLEGAGPRTRPESGGIKPRAGKVRSKASSNGDQESKGRNGNGHPAGNGNGHAYAEDDYLGSGAQSNGAGHQTSQDRGPEDPRHFPEPHSGAGDSPAVLTAAALDEQLQSLMGDAPFCDLCGHVTVRNGSCYKCLNCGNSQGCS